MEGGNVFEDSDVVRYGTIRLGLRKGYSVGKRNGHYSLQVFLIERINLEQELQRQSNFLKTIEQKLDEKRTYEKVRSKVWVMEKISSLNRKLYGKEEHQKEN